MKPPRAIVFTLFYSLSSIQAKLLYSGPEDLYAFPKHRVTFLNNLPVQNETAQHWLNEGLRGGESEFLNDRWDESAWFSNAVYKEIGSSELEMSNDASQICMSPRVQLYLIYSQSFSDLAQSPIPDNSGYMLNHMKMGPDNEFICLIPPARDTPIQVQENIDQDVVLRNGWSLLEPLSGKCLYVRYLTCYFLTCGSNISYSTAKRGSHIHTATIKKSDSSRNSLTRNLAQQVRSFPFGGV